MSPTAYRPKFRVTACACGAIIQQDAKRGAPRRFCDECKRLKKKVGRELSRLRTEERAEGGE